MKVTYTFSFEDVLRYVTELLQMKGATPLLKGGELDISFNTRKKEIVANCEPTEIPTVCPVCRATLNDTTTSSKQSPENDAVMSMEQLKQRSRAINSAGPRTDDGIDPYAANTISLMTGESFDPPFDEGV